MINYHIFRDIINTLFIVIITFFIFTIVNLYCMNKNLAKFTLMFTMMINNLIIIHYTKMSKNDNTTENVILMSFIMTLIIILFKTD